MRIISGKYRGKKLRFPKDRRCRPTQDRVKESLFNVIQDYCVGAVVLDLFGGTGGLGIEALSRGAEKVIFVDLNTTYLKKNLEELSGDTKILKMRAEKYLSITKEKFDVIFVDPPWDQFPLYEKTLLAICHFDILKPDGITICEHKRKIEIPIPEELKIKSQYDYGDTSLKLLVKK